MDDFPIDPEIEGLHLVGDARQGAYIYKSQWPDTVFKSGRRDRFDQAHAMATNVVAERKWILRTYRYNEVTQALQNWVDDNPNADTVEMLADGLLLTLNQFTDDDFSRLNFFHHLSGRAFDVRPVFDDTQAARIAALRALPGLGLFLTNEGGLIRWHAQFES